MIDHFEKWLKDFIEKKYGDRYKEELPTNLMRVAWYEATKSERNKVCIWTRAFDGHFNISCPSGQRGNGNFKKDNAISDTKWDFTNCPYCGGNIEVKNDT